MLCLGSIITTPATQSHVCCMFCPMFHAFWGAITLSCMLGPKPPKEQRLDRLFVRFHLSPSPLYHTDLSQVCHCKLRVHISWNLFKKKVKRWLTARHTPYPCASGLTITMTVGNWAVETTLPSYGIWRVMDIVCV
jgi:hypothetical protein